MQYVAYSFTTDPRTQERTYTIVPEFQRNASERVIAAAAVTAHGVPRDRLEVRAVPEREWAQLRDATFAAARAAAAALHQTRLQAAAAVRDLLGLTTDQLRSLAYGLEFVDDLERLPPA